MNPTWTPLLIAATILRILAEASTCGEAGDLVFSNFPESATGSHILPSFRIVFKEAAMARVVSQPACDALFY